MGKLIIISAPSGTGKSTLISRLLAEHPELHLGFSVSATSRPPRGQEQHGVEYYFFSPEEFKAGIERGDLLEHEEVYPGRYYGTLRSEVDRRIAAGDRVIFDVDCVGGLNIKKGYGHEALSIFIEPPSIEELRRQAQAYRQTYDSTLRYMGDSLSRVYKLDPRAIEEIRRQARDIRHSYDSIQHQMGDQLERARRFYRGRR